MVNNNFSGHGGSSGCSATNFAPHAAYFEALDCIEYVNKDCTIIAERIDELLTLFRKNGTQEYVGFKIKGFRNYFEKTLKGMYALTEEDFVRLTSVMEAICRDKAETVLSGSMPEKTKSAYKIAYDMAHLEAVNLSNFDLREAA